MKIDIIFIDVEIQCEEWKIKYEKTKFKRFKIVVEIVNKQTFYEIMKIVYDVFLFKIKNVVFDDEFSNRISNLKNDTTFTIFDVSKKTKRSQKHSNSLIFTNDVNSKWFTWIIKIYDKFTINNDWYDIFEIEIIVIINWIDENVDEHIQKVRNSNANYFKNIKQIIEFLNDIFDNSNRKRNKRREFKNLIMSKTQNFQSFHSKFLRMINQIEYDEITIFDEFFEKFTLSLKQALTIHFREFEFFAKINIEFQRISNKLNIIKKNKIKVKTFRLNFIYFKIVSIVANSISFVKFSMFVSFAKFSNHVYQHIKQKSRNSIINNLINIDICFTCDKFNQIWFICSNVDKYKERQ